LEEARANVRQELSRAEARADASESRAVRWKSTAKQLWRRLAAAEARLRELGVAVNLRKV
jgi:chromosome segregation ATPase